MMWKRIISFAVMMGLLCPLAWAESEKEVINPQFRLYDFTYLVTDIGRGLQLKADEDLSADLGEGIDLHCEDIPEAFDLLLELEKDGKFELIEHNSNVIPLNDGIIEKYIHQENDQRYIEIVIRLKFKKPEQCISLFEKWSYTEKDVGYRFPIEGYTIPIWRGRIYHADGKGKLELHLCAACQIDETGIRHGMENTGVNKEFISDQRINWNIEGSARIMLAECLELKGEIGKDEDDCWLIDDKNVKSVSLYYNKDKAASIQSENRAREENTKVSLHLGEGTKKPNEIDGSSENENNIPVSSETAVEAKAEGIISDASAENSKGDLETFGNIPVSSETAVEAKAEGIISDAGVENSKGDLETSGNIPVSSETAVEAKTEEIMSDAGAENSKGDLETSSNIPTSSETAVEAKSEGIMSDASAENSKEDLETSGNIPTSSETAVEAKTEDKPSDVGGEDSEVGLTVKPIELDGEAPLICPKATEIKGTKDGQYDISASMDEETLPVEQDGEKWSIPLKDELLESIKESEEPIIQLWYSVDGKQYGQIERPLAVDFTAPSIVEVKPEDSTHVISKGDNRFDVFGDGDTVKLIITANDEFDKVVDYEPVEKAEDGKSCVIELQPSEDAYELCIEDENGNRSETKSVTLHRVTGLTLKNEGEVLLCPNSEEKMSLSGTKDAGYAVMVSMEQAGDAFEIDADGEDWFWKPSENVLKSIKESGADEVHFRVYYADAKEQCVEGSWQVDYQAPRLSVEQETFTVLPGDSVKVKIECETNAKISSEPEIPEGEDSTFELKPTADNTTYTFVAVDEHGNESDPLKLTVVWVPETEIKDIEVNPTEVTLGPKNAEIKLKGHAHPDWRVIVSGDELADISIDVDEDGSWNYGMDGSKLNGGKPKDGDEYKLRLSYPEAYPGKKQEVLLRWDTKCELSVDPIMEGATRITGKTDPGAEISLSGWDGTVKATEDDDTFLIELTQPAKVGEYKIRAVDAYGNEAEEKVTVNKAVGDKIPQISIKAMADNDGRLTIRGTADKDYTVILSVANDQEVITEMTTAGDWFEKRFDCPEDGQYTVTARYDGYFSDYKETTDVIVDTTAPEIKLNSTEIKATATELSFDVSDNSSEPVTLRVELDKDEIPEKRLESSQNKYTIRFDSGELTGKEKLVITATDAKGNPQSVIVKIEPETENTGENGEGTGTDNNETGDNGEGAVNNDNETKDNGEDTVNDDNETGDNGEDTVNNETGNNGESAETDNNETGEDGESAVNDDNETGGNGENAATDDNEIVDNGDDKKHERIRGYILQTVLFGVLTILFGVLFLYSNKQYQRMRNAQIDRKSGASHMTMRSDRNGKI